MEVPVTARHVAVTAALSAGPATPVASKQVAAVILTCAVCEAAFAAKRPTAQCCSGRCRMALSRARRVAEVAGSLAMAEAALGQAASALRKVRALVEAGAGKLAP